jgi:hypothetical protein
MGRYAVTFARWKHKLTGYYRLRLEFRTKVETAPALGTVALRVDVSKKHIFSFECNAAPYLFRGPFKLLYGNERGPGDHVVMV